MKFKRKSHLTIAMALTVLGSSSVIADEIGGGTPGNGTNNVTDPDNDGGTVETVESSSTVEAWWNELLEDLGFVAAGDEAGADSN